ncbi:Sialic acid TRAP transporter permease protein SiaT [subsurface metagenome]|nr:TRAP transporter large permease subunit [Clostridia bacterium]
MTSSLLLLIIFAALLILKMPISIAMGISVLISMIAGGNSDALYIIPQQMVEGVMGPVLLAVPFFIFAANLMNETGLTDKIFNFASALVGHLRGGLAQVNVVASMVFAGCSGAAVADCAGLGKIEIKAMSERGYKRSFAAAVTLASSSCGPIIPPSIPMVIYAIIAGVSVGRLFLAGIIPGILIGISLMVINYISSFTMKDFPPPEKRVSFSRLIKSFSSGIFALFSPIIIVGGLVGGFTTASEAGILAAMYTLVLGLVSQGPGKVIKILPKVLSDSAIDTIGIMFILSTSTAMGWLISLERVPMLVATTFLALTNNKLIFLLLVNLFVLFLGMIMPAIPILLIMAPIFVPLATQLGIDKIHFGLIMVYGIVIGIATPPVGLGLFILTKVANIKFEEVTKAVLPFLIPLLIVLLLITYVPQITLFLPNLLMGK